MMLNMVSLTKKAKQAKKEKQIELKLKVFHSYNNCSQVYKNNMKITCRIHMYSTAQLIHLNFLMIKGNSCSMMNILEMIIQLLQILIIFKKGIGGAKRMQWRLKLMKKNGNKQHCNYKWIKMNRDLMDK